MAPKPSRLSPCLACCYGLSTMTTRRLPSFARLNRVVVTGSFDQLSRFLEWWTKDRLFASRSLSWMVRYGVRLGKQLPTSERVKTHKQLGRLLRVSCETQLS